MEKNKHIDAMTKVVEILTPLPSEERGRVIRAAMALLGEAQSNVSPVPDVETTSNGGQSATNLPPRARAWMKQYAITENELQNVFHINEDGVDVIANVPGKNKKEQTYNAYILTGVAQLFVTGTASFQDKPARTLCETSGCYDQANHSAHLRDRGNEFTGTKDKGWTLTAPGLKRAAEIIKELNKQTT
jgi:hypothetical protein